MATVEYPRGAGIVFRFLGAWFFIGGDRGVVVDGWESESCPKTCFCNIASKIVYCSRRGLTAIPESVPLDTLQLNLNGNQMQQPSIRRSNLSHLVALEHLYLSECAIEELEVGAFGNLRNLKWLDLSNNQIEVIHDRTFDGLNLQHLFLNGNRNLQLRPDSFDGLLAMGLYLHDCSVARLTPDVLVPLEHSLKNLWLNGNEIDRLDRRFEALFARLQHLRLGTNPLRCGCDAVWLKEFFDRNPDVFRGSLPPSCLAPPSLKGRYFSELSPLELRCRTPQFTAVEALFEAEAGRLRCAAAGDPAPVLYWIQPSGKTSKFLPSSDEPDEESSQNEALLTLRVAGTDRAAHLSGMYICVANNEAGNATLSVTVPWPPPPPTQSLPTPPVLQLQTLGTTRVEPTPIFTPTPDPLMVVQNVSSPIATPFADIEYRLLEDSLKILRRSTTASIRNVTKGKHIDLHLNVPVRSATGGRGAERLFTVGELTWAVVTTHLLTIVVCVTAAIVCHERRKNRKRKLSRSNMQSMDCCNDDLVVYDKSSGKQDHTDTEDPSMSESVYLNSLRHHRLKYYMNPSPIFSEHPMLDR